MFYLIILKLYDYNFSYFFNTVQISRIYHFIQQSNKLVYL